MRESTRGTGQPHDFDESWRRAVDRLDDALGAGREVDLGRAIPPAASDPRLGKVVGETGSGPATS